MPLLQAVAATLSNNDLQVGVIEEIIERDDLFALLPFQKTEGKAYVYNREATVSEGVFLDPNDTIPEEASTSTEVTTNLRIIAGDVDVDKFLTSTMGDTNNLKAIQIAAKAKGMGRAFRRALVQGNNSTNPKSFDGIEKLVTDTGNVLDGGVNGSALSFDMLDELKDMVANGPDCYMMRRGTYRALKQLLRAAGGNTAERFMFEDFGFSVPAFDGVPIIINDYILGDVDKGTSLDTCSIYAMRLNEVDGLHGIYGGETAGIVVEELGTNRSSDSDRTRLKAYWGLALKSTQSLASINGVLNV
jgi:hypothetical protein